MMDGGDAPSAKFTLKESISRTFGTGFLDGSITAVSAEKATMAPPGAPPMGLPMMLGMIGQVKEALSLPYPYSVPCPAATASARNAWSPGVPGGACGGGGERGS